MNLRILIIVGFVIQLFWLPMTPACARERASVVQQQSCAGCCAGCAKDEAPQPDPERVPCRAVCPKCDMRPSQTKIVPSERDATTRRLLDRNDAPEVTYPTLTSPTSDRIGIRSPQYEHPPPLREHASVSALTGRWLC